VPRGFIEPSNLVCRCVLIHHEDFESSNQWRPSTTCRISAEAPGRLAVLIWRRPALLCDQHLSRPPLAFHESTSDSSLVSFTEALRYRWSGEPSRGETLAQPVEARGSKVASPLIDRRSRGRPIRSATFCSAGWLARGLGAIESQRSSDPREIATEECARNSESFLDGAVTSLRSLS